MRDPLSFHVDSSYVVIGNIHDAAQGATIVLGARNPGHEWRKLPQRRRKYPVDKSKLKQMKKEMQHSPPPPAAISMALPASQGIWHAQVLYTQRSGKPVSAGGLFWHPEHVVDPVQILWELEHLGGGIGVAEEPDALLDRGVRFIGRYDWNSSERDDDPALPKGLTLLPDAQRLKKLAAQVMDTEAYLPDWSPNCFFATAESIRDAVLPWYLQRYQDFQSGQSLPDLESMCLRAGVAPHLSIIEAEYMFGRVWFSTEGRAVALLFYTYNMPEFLCEAWLGPQPILSLPKGFPESFPDKAADFRAGVMDKLPAPYLKHLITSAETPAALLQALLSTVVWPSLSLDPDDVLSLLERALLTATCRGLDASFHVLIKHLDWTAYAQRVNTAHAKLLAEPVPHPAPFSAEGDRVQQLEQRSQGLLRHARSYAHFRALIKAGHPILPVILCERDAVYVDPKISLAAESVEDDVAAARALLVSEGVDVHERGKPLGEDVVSTLLLKSPHQHGLADASACTLPGITASIQQLLSLGYVPDAAARFPFTNMVPEDNGHRGSLGDLLAYCCLQRVDSDKASLPALLKDAAVLMKLLSVPVTAGIADTLSALVPSAKQHVIQQILAELKQACSPSKS